MARDLEGQDDGGQGDYTKEKYEQSDYSMEEILAMKRKVCKNIGSGYIKEVIKNKGVFCYIGMLLFSCTKR